MENESNLSTLPNHGDMSKIVSSLDKHGWASFTSAGLTSLCNFARAEYLANKNSFVLHSPVESFTPEDLQISPWRKLAIGSHNGLGEPYAQLLQTTYFSEVDTRYPNLSSLFFVMKILRNDLLGIDRDFGSNRFRDHFWNACRIHHYPIGGGFMMEHCDTYFPRALADSSLPFLQVMALLSTKGVNYTEGGGHIVDRDGRRFNFEDEFGLGTIVVFDGSIRHGVSDTDRNEILNFQSDRGRIAAFINVYEAR